jgi:hypothetical protein
MVSFKNALRKIFELFTKSYDSGVPMPNGFKVSFENLLFKKQLQLLKVKQLSSLSKEVYFVVGRLYARVC